MKLVPGIAQFERRLDAKHTRSTSTASSSSEAVADWARTIQIPDERAEKLLTGWKKLWYQQLRTQVSQSEVETEGIENAAASTANNYVDAKRLSRFRDRQHFKNLRSTEELMEAMSASRQESHATAQEHQTAHGGGEGALTQKSGQQAQSPTHTPPSITAAAANSPGHKQTPRSRTAPHPYAGILEGLNTRWQTIRDAITQAFEETVTEETKTAKQPWITTWDLIQQRIHARKNGDKAAEQDVHKEVRKQDKTQWLKDRLAESEETGCQNEIEMGQTYPLRIQAETGLTEGPRGSAHQLFQADPNLRRAPLEPTTGSSTALVHGQTRAHSPHS